MNLQIDIKTEAEMIAWGQQLAASLGQSVLQGGGQVYVVYLSGGLGAGKTTLVKGVLRGLGYPDAVTSPTYTLVERYQVRGFNVIHFDLYRLQQAEELEYLGIRDMLDAPALCLVEWPDHGAGVLPSADLAIDIEQAGQGRKLVVSD